MDIRRVAVIGGGTMGSGIAHVLARSDFDVILCDIDHPCLQRARQTIETNLGREAAKGKIPASAVAAALTRIRLTTDLPEAATAELIIEAVPERRELKTELFKKLDASAGPDVIFATNTSSISITELAAVSGRPDRFIGMHFMNPVPVMKLVEVIRGLATSQPTFETVRDVAVQVDKTPVEVQDYPGFVSNRVLMPMINEAAFCVMEGIATASAVDEIMKLGMNHPMGPLALADFIGLDVCLDIMEVLYRGFNDSKYRACPLLRKMVAAGWLGRKSGRGFYEYQTRATVEAR